MAGLVSEGTERIEPGAEGGRPCTAPVAETFHHKSESNDADRFISVVGHRHINRRLFRHACPTLLPLYRTRRYDKEHVTVLCAVDRTDLVRHALPDTALGTHWCDRTVFNPAFRSGGGSSCCVSRSPASQAEPRIPNGTDQRYTEFDVTSEQG